MNFLLDFVLRTSKIFFFLLIVALSSNSHAQWWVDGGNLLWTYGNVSISQGNLSVGGSFNVTGMSTFLNDIVVSDETYSPIQFRNIDEVPLLELNPNHTSVTLGDIDYNNAGTTIFVSDWQQLIRLYTADSLLVDCFGKLLIGDASNLQYGTLISVLDDYRKININADSTNITGDLNVKGTIKSSDYEHIILAFDKNGDDQELNVTVYRNDTGTTIDSVYWSGGTYGSSQFIVFSGGVVNASTQTLYYNYFNSYTYADTGYVDTHLYATRSGQDNRILLEFRDAQNNAIDLFSGSFYIDFTIIPTTASDSYYKSW